MIIIRLSPISRPMRASPKYASNLVYVNHAGKEGTVALGLDTSMVVVERVPLIINQRNRNIKHIMQIVEE